MKGLFGGHVARWAGIGIQMVMFPAAHAGVPWALSLLASRHGWFGGRPSLFNVVGLILVAAGFYIFFLCSREHYRAAPTGWLVENLTPSYLLTDGPYRYSRNPIYLAELTIWLGWILFYGSFAVAGLFAVAALLIGLIVVPCEERGLEAKWGIGYHEFRRTTPRWLGEIRR